MTLRHLLRALAGAGAVAAGLLLLTAPTAALADGLTGIPVHAVEGNTFSGAVATYSVSGTIIGATIYWGDGSSSSGSWANGAINGNHTYAESGSYEVTESVTVQYVYYRRVCFGFFFCFLEPVFYDYSYGSGSAATVVDAALSGTAGNGFSVQEGTATGTLNNLVTFTDGNPNGTVTDFSAELDWGDGTTSGGTVSWDPSKGVFAVASDGHTYADEGTHQVIVKVRDVDGAVLGPSLSATVTDAPLSVVGSPRTVMTTEGSPSGTVQATFQDANPLASAGEFAVSIDWGDGSGIDAASGKVTALMAQAGCTPSCFSVTTVGHTYAEEGSYTVKVLLWDSSGASAVATPTVLVVDAGLSATAVTNAGVEGSQLASLLWASFSDANPQALSTDFNASIDWGDGSTPAAGSISGGPTFTVSGPPHSYSEEGTYTVKVTIHDAGGSTASVSSTAIIADPAVSFNGVAALAAVEGQNTGLLVLGTFSDPGGAEAPGDYTARIDWGDGSSAQGVVTDSGFGVFAVDSAHVYSEEGKYTITVTVSHDSAPAATATDAVTVSDAAIVVTGGLTFAASEGATGAMQTIATFVDPGGPESAGDYSASIDWGDGFSGVGTISLDQTTGTFAVHGSHLYVEEGAPTITVSVTHGSNAAVVATSAAAISDPGVVPGGGFTYTATEGQTAGAQTVASFTDPGGAEALADYAATIAWGDGSTGTGTISLASGVFSVAGTHTYAEEGSFTITVTVTHDSAPAALATSKAVVADPSVLLSLVDAIGGVEGQSTGQEAFGFVTDPGGAEGVDDYKAKIDWGDGTTSPATLTFNAVVGRFLIFAGHTYAEEGNYSASVTVSHDSAATVSGSFQARIADARLSFSFASFQPVEGNQFSGSVGRLQDGNPGAPASDFTVSIDWGDVSQSGGTAVALGGGVFDIRGSHTYAEEGGSNIWVTVLDTGGSGASAGGSIQIADAPLTAAAGPGVVAVVGQPLSPTLATFNDGNPAATVADFSASIDWGDGSSSPGTVSAAGTGFQVAGMHTYGRTGSDTIKVVILDGGGSRAAAALTATINGLVLVLDPASSGALALDGQANIQSSWPVAVDSASPAALIAGGQGQLTAPSVSIDGGATVTGKASVKPQPATGAAPTQDPFAALAAPSLAGLSVQGNGLTLTGPTTLAPGVYQGGLTIAGHAAVTLQPGIYVLQGGGLSLSSGASISGDGVLIALEPASGSGTCGSVGISGGTVDLKSPLSGPGAGIALWVAAGCGSSSGIAVSGDAKVSLVGALYAPAGALDLSGRGGIVICCGVVDRLSIGGTGKLTAV